MSYHDDSQFLTQLFVMNLLTLSASIWLNTDEDDMIRDILKKEPGQKFYKQYKNDPNGIAGRPLIWIGRKGAPADKAIVEYGVVTPEKFGAISSQEESSDEELESNEGTEQERQLDVDTPEERRAKRRRLVR